jgi:DNA polymerase III epsilon subunit-like protein
VKLTFVDTETTGLPDKEPFLSSPELGPEITEYAIADWNDGEVTGEFHKLIWPRNPPEPDAEGICRTLAGFPMSMRHDVWKRASAITWNTSDDRIVRERLSPNHLAGSNPRFDCDRFAFEMRRNGALKNGKVPWSHRYLNTASLGYLLWVQGKVEKTGLVYLAQFFGIEHDAHTSLGDVRAAIGVWEHMYEEFIGRPARWKEALAEIVKHSPDASMAEFAAEELAAG